MPQTTSMLVGMLNTMHEHSEYNSGRFSRKDIHIKHLDYLYEHNL